MNGIVDILIEVSNLGAYLYGPFVRSKIIPYKRKSILSPDIFEIDVWFRNITSLNFFKESSISKGGNILPLPVGDTFQAGEDDIKDEYRGKEEDLKETYSINSPKGVKEKYLFYPFNYEETNVYFVLFLSRKLPFDFFENRLIFFCPEDGENIRKKMRFFDLMKKGKVFFVTPMGNKIIEVFIENKASHNPEYNSSSFPISVSHSSSNPSFHLSSSSSNPYSSNSFSSNSSFHLSSSSSNPSSSNPSFHLSSSSSSVSSSSSSVSSSSSSSSGVTVKSLVSFPSLNTLNSFSSYSPRIPQNSIIEEIIDNCVSNELIFTEKYMKKILSYELGSEICNQLIEDIVSKYHGYILKYKASNNKYCGFLIDERKNIIYTIVSLYFFIKSANDEKYYEGFNLTRLRAKRLL